jgi:hypothetical protein
MSFIRNFAPRRFDSFDYIASEGASGGILLLWNSSIFLGTVIDKQRFAITATFCSVHNSDTWKLSTVYGPCREPGRSLFIQWFRAHQIDDEENWLFVGDFNFYRSLEDRNRPGGNLQDTFVFNDAIGHLGLVELPLKGRAYTWSNMQSNPLLEQLDWFFSSVNWTHSYPATEIIPLTKITSDHIPCKISIGTSIPRSNIFRFENFWTEHAGFAEVVQNQWHQPQHHPNIANTISSKFKSLRYGLKRWSKCLSNLKLLISNCNKVILWLDMVEELRSLYSPEWNLRQIVKSQLAALLRYQNQYWKKRYTVNRVKLGDECTKFFHAMATISHRKNSIPQLLNDDGAWILDHDGKAALIWNSFKARMGVSTEPTMLFDLQTLFNIQDDFTSLVEPFTHADIDNVVKRLPSDKAPGPDGFNGFFVKKCWHVIKEDFYKLCDDFFHGSLCIDSINSSFVTLVPKVNNPETGSDYRPISLLNCSLKILTKLLADRL